MLNGRHLCEADAKLLGCSRRADANKCERGPMGTEGTPLRSM